jgi:porin
LVLAIFFGSFTSVGVAQTEDDLTTSTSFGGPSSPEGQIEERSREKVPAFRFDGIYDAFEPWREWTDGVKDEHGFAFSGQYAIAAQGANESLGGGSTSGSSGVLRLNGVWELLNRGQDNPGKLVVMLDHRHEFNGPAPANLAGDIGYIGVTNTFFNDIGFAVINLNWQQSLNSGNSGFVTGRYDPNDYMNILGYVNPFVSFTNLAVVLDVSVALPDSSWGIGAGHWFNDQWYVLGGVNDANGNATDNLEFFDGGSEFFKYAHVGWSPSKSQRYYSNVHLLIWDVDERDEAGVNAADGFAIGANWTFDKTWMPFLRYGESSGDSPIYNKSATIGLLRKFHFRSDVAGIAINWGETPPVTGSTEQTTMEAFWNIQFARNLAFTPNIQYLRNPALNPTEDEIWSVGIRTRITF